MLTLTRPASSRNASSLTSLSALYLNLPCQANTITRDTMQSLMEFIRSETKLMVNLLGIVIQATGDDELIPDSLEDINTQIKLGVLYISSKDAISPLFSCQQNILFRIMHDLHHHTARQDFTFQGEYETYKYACERLEQGGYGQLKNKRVIKSILYSEIVLQAAVYHATLKFPPQKVVLLPTP